MRTVYDSTSISDVPEHAENLLCYVDGHYPTNATEARKRFPKARVFTITLDGGTANADFVDCEPGACWPPSHAAAWVKHRKSIGKFAGVYCGESNWPEVKAAMKAAGVSTYVGQNYLIAAYPGDGPVIPKGAIGHQWQGSPGNSPGHYDVSVFLDYIPGLDPKPKPPKPEALSEDAAKALTDLLHHLKIRAAAKPPIPLSATPKKRFATLDALVRKLS